MRLSKGEKESKAFFFEKKKQKTSLYLASAFPDGYCFPETGSCDG
jgi:hypothetical protein